MRYSTTHQAIEVKKMNSAVFKHAGIVLGLAGLIWTLTFDLFKPGPAEFGQTQLMGFIVSLMILLAGLRNLFRSRARLLDTIILWVYLGGMLYLVLMPKYFTFLPDKQLLQITEFLPRDFAINILGFIPFGYLLMSRSRPQETASFGRYMAVALYGLLLSLLIEVVQYYIPGRTSAINDIVANGLGGIVGVLVFYIEWSLTTARRG